MCGLEGVAGRCSTAASPSAVVAVVDSANFTDCNQGIFSEERVDWQTIHSTTSIERVFHVQLKGVVTLRSPPFCAVPALRKNEVGVTLLSTLPFALVVEGAPASAVLVDAALPFAPVLLFLLDRRLFVALLSCPAAASLLLLPEAFAPLLPPVEPLLNVSRDPLPLLPDVLTLKLGKRGACTCSGSGKVSSSSGSSGFPLSWLLDEVVAGSLADTSSGLI